MATSSKVVPISGAVPAQEDQVFITELSVLNIGGVEKFESVVGSVCIISGANEAGKSSLLNAVESVLAGGHDPAMIRRQDLDGDGIAETPAKSASIILKLSDGATVTKKITAKESTLEIKTKDGGLVNAPATYLKSLAPAGSFDPMGFLLSDPKDRAAFLLKTLPLTFTAAEVNKALDAPNTVDGIVSLQRLNELREGRYDTRKDLNVRVRDMTGNIRSMEESLPSTEGTDWAALRDSMQADLTQIDVEVGRIEAEINAEATEAKAGKKSEIEAKIAALRQELADFNKLVDDKAAETLKEQTAELLQRKTAFSEQLGQAKAKADESQRAEGVRRAIAEQRKKLDGHIMEEMRLTSILKALDDLKTSRLKTLPIEGLDITKDAKDRPIILIGGIPLDKLNRAQQLSVAIEASCLASGPLRLTICEAAEFDDDTMQIVAESFKKARRQLIVARWKNGEPLKVTNVFGVDK